MTNLSTVLANKGLEVGTSQVGGGGGGAVVSGNAATFDTLNDLEIASIDPSVNTVNTSGYYSIGDHGGATYKRKAQGDPIYELDRTSNAGTVHWELIPVNYEINIRQAGARGMNTFNGQDVDDYPSWRAIDKFAKAKGLVGFTCRFPAGFFFFSKAIHLKRLTCKVVGEFTGMAGGQGTVLRFPTGQSGIITNYKWGAGHDYSIAIPSFGINKGNGNYVSSDQPNKGDVYRCTAAGTSGPNGAADLVGHTTLGVPFQWGTATMVYEGNIITEPVQGGGIMDYDCGGDDNSSAGGCVIENIELWGFFDPRQVAAGDARAGLWKYNNAGIVMRVRARVSNCWTLGFQGHGLAIVADGDPDLKGPGNVNGWYVTNHASYYNGKDGIHVGYSDANAGSAYQIDVAQNNRWGIADWCFLTNLWTGIQSAYDGRGYPGMRQYYPQCQYQGWIYMSALPILGSTDWPAYINETPGGANNAWIRYYKCGADYSNAQMHITSTNPDNSLVLGAATGGHVTFATAGAVDGSDNWYLIEDGGRFELMSAPYHSAGPTVLRAQQKLGQAGGVVASSGTAADGAPLMLPSLSGAATITLIAPAQDPENAAYWHSTITFEPAGAFSSNNLNARILWLDPYIEGGTLPAQWCFPSTVVGGIMGDAYDETRGATIFTENRFRSLTTQTQIQGDDGTFPKFAVTINAPPNTSGNAVVTGWTDYNGTSLALRQESTGSGASGFTGGDTVFDIISFGLGNGGNPFLRFRTGGAHNFGRTSSDWTNEQATHITNLVIGDGGATDGRSVTYGTAPPGSGAHAQGEFIFNIAPTAAGTLGWTCTAAGTPGTWKAVSGIAA